MSDTPVPEVIAEQMALDREQRRGERQALVAIPAADVRSAPQRLSFAPQSMGEAMQLATMMARSTFVPGFLQGKEGDCLAIVLQASRWGMDPFAVASKSYFTKEGAPPAFEAQLVNAVVNSSGALRGRLCPEFTGEGEKLRCTVRGFLRADPDNEKTVTQSIARIRTRNSPLWKDHPEQQLGYYTTRAWARMHCPEVLLGVYTPDELDLLPKAEPSRPRPHRRDFVEQGGEAADAEGKQQQADSEPATQSLDLPADDAEWNIWADDARKRIAAAQTADAVNALFAQLRDAIEASPEALAADIRTAFTDRIGDLLASEGDAA